MAKNATLTVQRWGNSLAVKAVTSYILGHQPKSLDWRARRARPHPLKRVPEESYVRACEILSRIIEIDG